MVSEQKPGKSRFLKVACPRCGHRQVVFGKSSSRVKCEKCNRLLVEPTGGKTRVRAPVKRTM